MKLCRGEHTGEVYPKGFSDRKDQAKGMRSERIGKKNETERSINTAGGRCCESNRYQMGYPELDIFPRSWEFDGQDSWDTGQPG